MSVLIKGMKMPTEGLVTVNIHSDGLVYVHGAYPTELHEAVSIPTPHGRLIDADELLEIIECLFKDLNSFENFMYNHGVGDSIATIKNAPTIIEAEEGEDDEHTD